jgi:curved DNA-binding protein CbpA
MPPLVPRQRNAFATRDVIASGIALLDVHADHFALLGLPRDATIDSIRAAYVALACHLHPDKLPELEPAAASDARRLFAHVNLAYGVLSDPARRADYLAQLPGEPAEVPRPRSPSHPEPLRTGTPTERARAAAEVAQRGMQALRCEDLPAAIELLARATELAPHDVDHAARLAWARFCASTDKAGIAAEVRRALERAASRSPTPVAARFYLGRVERMLGRAREALHHFHEVLLLDPSHAEAAAEIRMLAPRTARR